MIILDKVNILKILAQFICGVRKTQGQTRELQEIDFETKRIGLGA